MIIILFIVLAVFWIWFLFFTWSLYIRRAHDLGHSGWFALLFLIPIVNLIMLIYFLCAKGEEGMNAYGPVNVGQPFWKSVFAQKPPMAAPTTVIPPMPPMMPPPMPPVVPPAPTL